MADAEERAGATGGYRRASPWPLFVALGIAISEIGVLFGVVPVAIGGLLLFGGSVAGILVDAGYAQAPWRPLGLVGGLLALVGSAVWTYRLPAVDPDAAIRILSTDGVALRGAAILAAGLLLAVAGSVGSLFGLSRS